MLITIGLLMSINLLAAEDVILKTIDFTSETWLSKATNGVIATPAATGKSDPNFSITSSPQVYLFSGETADISYNNAGDGTVTFSSDNENVATVSADGKITAKNVGNATITATLAETDNFDGGEKTISVIVKPNYNASINVYAHFESRVENSKEGFFSLTENNGVTTQYNRKYTGTYNGKTYTQGLKMQNGTTIKFTTLTDGDVVVVQSIATLKNLIKIDGKNFVNDYGVKSYYYDDLANNVRIYTIRNLASGTHTITRTSELGILYVGAYDPSIPSVVYNWPNIGTTTAHGTATVTDNVNVKGVSTPGIKFANGLSPENYVEITVDGGFKAGDIISFSGCIYNNNTSRDGAIAIAKDAADGELLLSKSELFNNTYQTSVSLTQGTFTLTTDATSLIIGRAPSGLTSATATWLTQLTVKRAATIATINLNEDGYATFSSAFDVKIQGANAYTAKVEEETIVCSKIEDNIIPAYNGVLLYGEPNTEVKAIYNETSATISSASNQLMPTTTAEGLAPVTSALVLNGNTFMQYSGSTFLADKAYLPYTQENVATPMRIVIESNPTNAKAVEAKAETRDTTTYNIAGQRVSPNAKGLIITGGKKFINN